MRNMVNRDRTGQRADRRQEMVVDVRKMGGAMHDWRRILVLHTWMEKT